MHYYKMQVKNQLQLAFIVVDAKAYGQHGVDRLELIISSWDVASEPSGLFAMTYRIYLRSPDQSVTHKTTTGDPVAALAAFRSLVDRPDLDGSQMLAVLNKDGRPVAHHRFDGLDPTKQWRGRIDGLDLGKAG